MERGAPTQAGQLGRSIGLGLLTSRHLVLAHGGRVGVRSVVDEGTTFTVLLPRQALSQGRAVPVGLARRVRLRSAASCPALSIVPGPSASLPYSFR